MLRYNAEIAICLPGQILQTKRRHISSTLPTILRHGEDDMPIISDTAKTAHIPPAKTKCRSWFPYVWVQFSILEESLWFKFEGFRIVLLVMCDRPRSVICKDQR